MKKCNGPGPVRSRLTFLILIALLSMPLPALAYLDPTTGSMLISAIVGLFASLVLAINLFGMLAIRIPGAYWLVQHYGVEGAWYAELVDLLVRCLLIIYRFRHGGWKHIEV